ncbi:sodium:proton exchanger [Desulfofustis glycolicus]|uniref:Cation:H+ antiporter n=1 Tax=Desulfofustis glycolicus DSM 9705 TaxID=1121409 RepID=A0A1M5W9A6_9BACT|nr:sodium:proton exchanger [Desulfofustis glycolicus]MCB2217343.1 sodium:proton exchanger [Desulfobulbaceae bacterium]SHH84018.1 cation:H+ antiporter [Desulfofustis glycolicus DSM 9705]
MKQLLVDSIGLIDLLIWLLVIFFFCGSALLFGGDLTLSFIGAGGVIVEMMIIGICIEVIIESLKQSRGIGTITGFITNGPEALCLIVGLAVGDILFAASTPLGSNFMNPLLLFIAALLCRRFVMVLHCRPLYSLTTIIVTACFAGGFFFIAENHYFRWLIGALVISTPLFFLRPGEPEPLTEDGEIAHPKPWLLPAIILLIGAGYLLDSVVSFAAEHSRAPKGVIGFFVLAALTSWPEFKSCLSLLNRGKILSAILNITVSNLTNIWLAILGVATYLFLH